MFFENLNEISRIAGKCGTAIFVVPNSIPVKIPKALTIEPENKSIITIEQIRRLILRLSIKQTSDQYIIIRPAEAMSEEAANAFLKSLEEPKEKNHFLLITDSPSKLLPTILSRSEIYFLKQNWSTEAPIEADESHKTLAKRLIVAKSADLVTIAEEITKKKEGVRDYTLTILGVAIEILYKTYLINGKTIFLDKIPKFLNAYDNIARNGHIKLHLVADLC